MPRTKKVSLTAVEKKYITLSLKTHNNVNYDELFKRLSIELDKPEQVIRDYMDKVGIEIKDEQLPPEPAKKELSPSQNMVRNLLTPNRNSENNKARHVTVMSEAASEAMEAIDPVPIKGSSKMKNCVFRQ